MAIVDDFHEKSICIQTDNGQVFVDKNFSIENNVPIVGMVKIEDRSDHRIYWFNFNAITWIGPRQ